MTKEFIECLDDETLLNQYADCYGQLVFCSDNGCLKYDVEILKAEILHRMKKN